MGEQEVKQKPRVMTDKDIYFAMIGALLLHELQSSRELRRKISGTALERKLKNIIKK